MKRKRLPPGVSHPVDVHVGGRMRARRQVLGMSQQRLGETVGLTFQQIQKYERGTNRIGASRLYQFGRVLGVPVSFFFERLQGEALATVAPYGIGAGAAYPADPLSRGETQALIECYYGIPDARVRARVFDLTKSLAD